MKTHQGIWPLGCVTQAFAGKDDTVRSVQVKTKSTHLVRPVDKICLLEGVAEREYPKVAN